LEKKLYRINKGKKLCGVCTGLAEYFDLDVNIVRLITVVAALTSFGIVGYIAAAIIIPEKPPV